MTQEQLKRFLGKYNELDQAYELYADKLEKATDRKQRAIYNHRMDKYAERMSGLRMGLEIMGYTFGTNSNGETTIMNR